MAAQNWVSSLKYVIHKSDVKDAISRICMHESLIDAQNMGVLSDESSQIGIEIRTALIYEQYLVWGDLQHQWADLDRIWCGF